MTASGQTNNLWRSLEIQARIVRALILREIITRFGRKGLGVLWLVIEPMLFTAAITAVWYAIKLNEASNIPVIEFSVTGWMSFLLWRNSANRCLNAIEANRALLYHRNIRVQDIFISRLLLELAGSTAAFALLVGLLLLVGLVEPPQNWFTLTVAWILLGWFALALGFLLGGLSHLHETFTRLWRIFSIVLMVMSGKFFMVHWLPEPAREVVLWLPMVHGLEMLRDGYWGQLVPTYQNPLYLVQANLLLTLLGLSIARVSESSGEPV